MKDIISALWAVTSNVTQSPDCLLANVQDRGRKKVNELRDSPSVDDDLSMLSGARGDVGQGPSSLELENIGEKVVKRIIHIV